MCRLEPGLVHISKEQTVQPVRETPSRGSARTLGGGAPAAGHPKVCEVIIKVKVKRDGGREREREERKERERERGEKRKNPSGQCITLKLPRIKNSPASEFSRDL